MENNVDRYAQVIEDLLFIANARIEVSEATHRLKKNLFVHELSEKPCCERPDAKRALRKIEIDNLIGELQMTVLPAAKRDLIKYTTPPTRTKIVYKKFISISKQQPNDGAELIAHLIEKVGIKTIMGDKL